MFYTIVHNNKVPLIGDNRQKIASWEYLPWIWYDFNLATASVDTANKNTITSGAYTRVWDSGTASHHLSRSAVLTLSPGTVFVSPTYSYDSSKFKYSGYKNSEGVSSFFGYPGLANSGSVINSSKNDITMFVIYKTSNAAATPINTSDIFVLSHPGAAAPGGSYSAGIHFSTGEIYASLNYQTGTSPGYVLSSTASSVSASYSKYYSIVATFSSNGHTVNAPFLRLSSGTSSSTGTKKSSIQPVIPYTFVQGNYANEERLMEVQVYSGILSIEAINYIESELKTKWNI